MEYGEWLNMRKSRLSVLNVLLWLGAANSFLSLLSDITPIKLYGLVDDWIQAYSSFISLVTTELFEWVNWQWFEVTHNEVNIMVFASLLAIMVSRAAINKHIELGGKWFLASVVHGAVSFLVLVLPIVIASILLPESISIIASGLYTVFHMWHFLFRIPDGDKIASSSRIRKEFGAALAVLAGVLIINSTLLSGVST
ncbi:hypothetical protein KW534_08110 [Vibrio fluvialis]|nr:hypothetical protein [Vibrio fluvialis]MBY8119995.1 hypothetical protein [Vibrio fluvialis]MBY8261146.1 hypothetical protein [Vibrio fluvialis]MBY8303058.1 hypothetical protein [Vibrio fluvialis]